MKGVKWGFRYHLGSIAFGSLIILPASIIKLLFEPPINRIRNANKSNAIVKCIVFCTSYLVCCLDRTLLFISKKAFIQIAITGQSFCEASWNSFALTIKNSKKYRSMNSIGFVFNFLGVAFISFANGLICYIILHTVS